MNKRATISYLGLILTMLFLVLAFTSDDLIFAKLMASLSLFLGVYTANYFNECKVFSTHHSKEVKHK
ncbi:MAG: hypothetical protein PSX81_12405 [bacterium]|nr:hypothetical protein [bacterium]